MNPKELLFSFENKYKFLYSIMVNGVPIYTWMRDAVAAILQDQRVDNQKSVSTEKGRIFPKRLIGSFCKLKKFRYAKTAIFTSAVYRRDNGRNLAAEYLLDKYPEAVVFEWPSRTDAFDAAYFEDQRKESYCPIDYYVFKYKLYCMLHRKLREKKRLECEKQVRMLFAECAEPENEFEIEAIRYLLKTLPDSYADTYCSHIVFRKLFSRYKNIEYAIDFWGGARENIIPVLPGKVRSVELQHGIITSEHPGYIYPSFVRSTGSTLFERKLLVYGEKTKAVLTKQSIFKEDQIEVIGNPRIVEYHKRFDSAEHERKLILFTSQPFEQDGAAKNYYETVFQILKKIRQCISNDKYSLGIKLHPRENNGITELYKKSIPDCEVFENTSQLYDLLGRSFLHITVSSTTLYEAALFGCPTVCIDFGNRESVSNYGFKTWCIKSIDDVEQILKRCLDKAQYEDYLVYLKQETMQYM